MIANEDTGPILDALGKRIHALRKEQGLSQETLSNMVGIDRSYLTTIEHGKRNISIDVLVRLCRGLGISLSKLFEGID